MANSSVKEDAFADLDLLKKVVDFKMKFYPRSWADYPAAKPGTLKLFPPDFRLPELQADCGRRACAPDSRGSLRLRSALNSQTDFVTRGLSSAAIEASKIRLRKNYHREIDTGGAPAQL